MQLLYRFILCLVFIASSFLLDAQITNPQNCVWSALKSDLTHEPVKTNLLAYFGNHRPIDSYKALHTAGKATARKDVKVLQLFDQIESLGLTALKTELLKLSDIQLSFFAKDFINISDFKLELIEAWKVLYHGNIDELLRKNTDLLESLSEYFSKYTDRINTVEDELFLATDKISYLQKIGVKRHDDWVEVLNIRFKISNDPLFTHVLGIERNASGGFLGPITRRRGGVTYTLRGFKGCHSENALKNYINNNPGSTYDIKNRDPFPLSDDVVYDGQPIIYIGGREYVKTNGRLEIYEPGKMGGTASFYPRNWSYDKIINEVEYAIKHNHGLVLGQPAQYFGYTSDGKIKIYFYHDSNGVIGSHFPIKP